MDDLLVERILRAVECVPAGRVVTYGQIAAVVGTGARHVGRVMSMVGGTVAWWRVLDARGRLPKSLVPRALPLWRAEGLEVDQNGMAVRISRHRLDLEDLRDRYGASVQDLPCP